MAGKTATLTVKIISDAKGASKGFDDAASKSEKFKAGLDKASIAAGAALGAVGALGKAAFDSASNLQQATGAVEAVFGKQAAAVKDLAKGAAQSAGLATSEYSNFAALIGSQLSNMGTSAKDLVPQTDALIKTGADLAAQYGGTTADAVSALSSALKGERDPIERYGISLSQASIDAEIAAQGLDTSTDASKRHATAVATMAIISKQGGSALGAFGREAGTAAGQQQRATAEWENAKAALGEALLPVVASAAKLFQGLATWLQNNAGTAQVLAGVVAGLAGTVLLVNGAVKVFSAVTTVARTAMLLFNIVMAANPLALVIIALAAIVAGVIIMYNKFSWFRDFVQTVAKAIGDFIVNFIADPIGTIIDLAKTVGGAFQAGFGLARDAVQWVIEKVKQLIQFVADMPVIRQVIDLVSAPAPAPAGPGVAGAALYGSTGPGLFGSALSSGSAGVGPTGRSAAPTPPPSMIVNVTVNGALDPMAVGKQLNQVLRDYASATGRRVTVAVSR